MVENSFSSGRATEDAIFSGEAPGKDADTEITGVLKLGNAATGMRVYAIAPAKTVTTESKTVMTGRRIQSSESVIFCQQVWIQAWGLQQAFEQQRTYSLVFWCQGVDFVCPQSPRVHQPQRR
ncbi:MAG: hypothetical protein RLZZ325_646 [Pseudomonadota bacterium]